MSLRNPFNLNFSPLSLSLTEIHLWYTFSTEILSTEVFQACYNLMNEKEKVAYNRITFKNGQIEYLITRAFIRTILSHYIQLDPEKFEFESNRYGRPEIAYPTLNPPLYFNLSHTNGIILCAVARFAETGIDVEDTRRTVRTAELANRFFSPTEASHFQNFQLASQPGNGQHALQDRFFVFWTLKESFIKARGLGLSLPLDRFTFQIKEDQRIAISFDPSFKEIPSDWQFILLRIKETFQVALSVKKGNMPDLKLTQRELKLWT